MKCRARSRESSKIAINGRNFPLLTGKGGWISPNCGLEDEKIGVGRCVVESKGGFVGFVFEKKKYSGEADRKWMNVRDSGVCPWNAGAFRV